MLLSHRPSEFTLGMSAGRSRDVTSPSSLGALSPADGGAGRVTLPGHLQRDLWTGAGYLTSEDGRNEESSRVLWSSPPWAPRAAPSLACDFNS